MIYRNERYFTSVFHMRDLAEFFDRMMLLLLAIWQISIHYEVLQLYRKSGVTVFMENTKINCKIDVSSKSASQVSRSAIELYSSSHSTRNITRPYPFHTDNDIKSSRRNEGMTTFVNQIDGDVKKSGNTRFEWERFSFVLSECTNFIKLHQNRYPHSSSSILSSSFSGIDFFISRALSIINCLRNKPSFAIRVSRLSPSLAPNWHSCSR